MLPGRITLRLTLTAMAGLVLVADFAAGFLVHRHRAGPYDAITWLIGKGPAHVEYTWLRSPSRAPESLRALGYVSSTFDEDAQAAGVLRHEPAAFAGWNLFHSEGDRRVQLMNMHGEVPYEWTLPFAPAHAELLDDGGLFAVDKDRAAVRVDARGRTLWWTGLPAHHGPAVGSDSVWVLTRYIRAVPAIHADIPVFDEGVARLDLRTGGILAELSLTELLLNSPYAFLLPSAEDRGLTIEDGPLDVLHANQVTVVEDSLAATSPLYEAGQLLVSLRNINAVILIAADGSSIDWIWGPSNLHQQHHPSILPNGNILVFDNRVVTSRVLEIEPGSNRVAWEFEDGPFFSPTRGSVQRLPNGNTLITESDRGYVFEIDPAGNTVWRFANPEIDPQGYRSVIWRMSRYPDAHPGILSLRSFRDIGPPAATGD